jgi:hypothetical protein
METTREATDAEVIGWVAGKYEERYGPGYVITDAGDVDAMVGQAAIQLDEHDARHLITECSVDRVPGEAAVRVRVATGSGLDLSCVRRFECSRRDPASAVHHALTEVLDTARGLLARYREDGGIAS